MGLNFYDYDSLQPKITPPKHFSWQHDPMTSFSFLGMDAIAQAMLCEELIGWSTDNLKPRTRIIVFISDQESHYALDGLLGGITEIFDDNHCHSDRSSGYDKMQNEFDYPSFGQVQLD